eukprot:SAG22_NODE_7219_length_760_cov_1.320726_1_plen_71_part_10
MTHLKKMQVRTVGNTFGNPPNPPSQPARTPWGLREILNPSFAAPAQLQYEEEARQMTEAMLREVEKEKQLA